ncbi:cupin domain-containing protein [Gordonia liuliyuniae]|uniref:Cupin type-2 domain-containing protein n=1 Tax=Gordonia liuliyuniae TaxID=2911517 RepID=A0ABS9IWB2_9ACTN|nr:cupin domain-containing protein [Gordonia liuliyuniae]MCF8589862.1 hypothetical protein [Gordonia liuliyuniae]
MNLTDVDQKARIVVTGYSDKGTSKVTSDTTGAIRYPSPNVTSTVLFEAESLPVIAGADLVQQQERYMPTREGVKVFLTSVAPDESWSADPDSYRETIQSAGLDDLDGRPPGFHQTPTVDIITVVSGEIYALLDEEEVLLTQGDTLVQRGTPHAWSNRSGQVAVISGVMVTAVDPAERN